MNRFLVRGFIFVLIIGALYWFFPDAERDETGAIVSEGALDVFSLKVNDCFNDKEVFDLVDGESVQIGSVEALPCSIPHDGEVYAISSDLFFQTSFPSDEEMEQIGYGYCSSEFLKFVGINYEASILDIQYLVPSLEGWNNSVRNVVCIVSTPESKSEGSYRGIGI